MAYLNNAYIGGNDLFYPGCYEQMNEDQKHIFDMLLEPLIPSLCRAFLYALSLPRTDVPVKFHQLLGLMEMEKETITNETIKEYCIYLFENKQMRFFIKELDVGDGINGGSSIKAKYLIELFYSGKFQPLDVEKFADTSLN